MQAWKIPTDFVPYRRGILEHLTTGKMSWHEFALYSLLLLKANEDTGMVERTNATEISGHFRHKQDNLDKRAIEYLLLQLEKKGYIKRFYGSRKNNYHILINKYYISGRGWVDVESSTSWESVRIIQAIETVETPPQLTGPRLWAAQKWSLELAIYYNTNIRPCYPPQIAKQIEGIDCEEWLIKKCTENYHRYIQHAKTEVRYRMLAKNFFNQFEFLTYQDGNMDKLITTTESIFDQMKREAQSDKVRKEL